MSARVPPVTARTACIVWFRQDLRLRDNPALRAAVQRGRAVIPLYIWSPEEEGGWPPGGASRWWLHESLAALDTSLRQIGSRLILARGDTLQILKRLASETRAGAVFWNRRYEPAAIACSARIASALQARGIDVHSFNSALLAEPTETLNQRGKPYQVYTPFKRSLFQRLEPAKPSRAPRRLEAPSKWPRSVSLQSLGLLPRMAWYAEMARIWQPGEAGAQRRLARFLKHGLANYRHDRERPAIAGTSSLSPHLHWGEIGPRQIWYALGPRGRSSPFLAELAWREFAHHLLYHFPATTLAPLRSSFAHFPWRRNARRLQAWQRGRTGIPLVDAGMRELWGSGWMHNRVRMVAGSLLVKNLLIPWQDGARWFWDTLVDADLANNTLNWQWIAGCGADAAPYFRIFNPITQAERFDSEGLYIRKWIPELGKAYPAPIVDLAESREAALAAYRTLKER